MMVSLGATLCLVLGVVSCSITTNYYQELINQETKKALSYDLPKNNEEFKEGVEAQTIVEYGEYDVVIVGAGSAGCVLATRLSEIENLSILLLEAGDEENDFNQIPAMFLYHQFSDINWGYYTTPQKYSCLGTNNRQCIIPRGKVIGGSSAINALIYARGGCNYYNKWTALGNRGWSCKDVLPYFKKSENSQIHGDEGYHGKKGFWNVEYSLPSSVLFNNYINGGLQINQRVVDYNGVNQFGAAKVQSSIKRGKRQSLGTAFLANARKRSNLKVVTKALVTKIIIDQQSRVTKGVEFVTTNQKFHVRAKKEVLVSAGAINTPQLLMLSGIGPKNHLKDMKIPVIADLPVGENLIEHPLFNVVVRTNYTLPDTNMDDLVELYLQGFGPLTKALGVDGIGFPNTDNRRQETPSIELLFSPPFDIDRTIFQRAMNFNATIGDTFIKKINPKSDLSIFVILLNEKSRGRIWLKSNSPIDFPNIDLNMFEKQEDVDSLIEGLQYAFNLTKTEAFEKLNVTLLEVPICTNFDKDSNGYLECLIRNVAVTIYHPCGTAAMGPDGEKFVLDDTLRVHGIKNLRVVDASVFPLPVPGHTNAVAVMVAEKAADLIKRKLCC